MRSLDILKEVESSFIIKKDFPEFSVGDTISVYYEIQEAGGKVRLQFFTGVCIQKKGQGLCQTFTVRKITHNDIKFNVL